ncbi:hypothetical protein ACA910_007348 [Epithemia clementina (nom. ined.)]
MKNGFERRHQSRKCAKCDTVLERWWFQLLLPLLLWVETGKGFLLVVVVPPGHRERYARFHRCSVVAVTSTNGGGDRGGQTCIFKDDEESSQRLSFSDYESLQQQQEQHQRPNNIIRRTGCGDSAVSSQAPRVSFPQQARGGSSSRSLKINRCRAAKELVYYSKILFGHSRHLKLRQNHQQEPQFNDEAEEIASSAMTVCTDVTAAKERVSYLLSEIESTFTLNIPNDYTIHATQSILISISHLVQLRGEYSMNVFRFEPMIQVVWRQLEAQEAEKYLCPRRWLECLQAATILRLEHVSPLYVKIVQRLTKGDAISGLKPDQFVQILMWASSGQKQESSRPSGHTEVEAQLLRSVARRLRKQGVRQMSSNQLLSKAIMATSMLLKQQPQYVPGSGAEVVEGELKQLAYTLMFEKMQRLDGNSKYSMLTLKLLTSQEAASMFGCAALVVVNGTDPMVCQLCRALEMNTTMETLTFADCSVIFQALTQWRYRVSSSAIREMGEALLVTNELFSFNIYPKPREVNHVLRCISLLYQSEPETVAPFRKLAEFLFQDKEFLCACSLSILSNFLWFSSVVMLSESVAITISEQILQAMDLNMQSVSPKVASRILSALTTLTVGRIRGDSQEGNNAAVRHLNDLLYQSFDVFGEYLFSKRLDPHDISSALGAYAKAGYTLEPSVIDHLTSLLVMRLEDCSVRQVVQSLWALAKMNEWDLACDYLNLSSDDNFCPGFLSHVPALASHLSCHANQLSTKDISQTIWSLARLEQYDEASIALWEPLLERVNELQHLMTAQETANSLWALSKMPRKAYRSVFKLTQHLRNEQILKSLKPQEATAILYALGRLDIRDEWVFSQLSQLILSKVEGTSSPAIAHVLWAHKKVHLRPPQEILDAWSSKKLGLVPVSSMNDDWHDIFLS